MQDKHARMTILIDPKVKISFEKMCAAKQLTLSETVRALIQQYLDAHTDSGPGAGQRHEEPLPEKDR